MRWKLCVSICLFKTRLFHCVKQQKPYTFFKVEQRNTSLLHRTFYDFKKSVKRLQEVLTWLPCFFWIIFQMVLLPFLRMDSLNQTKCCWSICCPIKVTSYALCKHNVVNIINFQLKIDFSSLLGTIYLIGISWKCDNFFISGSNSSSSIPSKYCEWCFPPFIKTIHASAFVFA